MFGRANLGRDPGERADRIDEFHRAVCLTADFTVVTVLVRRVTVGARTRSLHKTIREKRSGLGIVKLCDILLDDEARVSQRLPDLMTHAAVVLAVSAAVVVELNPERCEVAEVRLPHVGDQRFFAPAFLTGTNHDGRAVRVVRADVDAAMASQLLEADPDVGLDVLDQMPQVNVAVGVGEGRGDKNASCGHASSVERSRSIGSASGGDSKDGRVESPQTTANAGSSYALDEGLFPVPSPLALEGRGLG